MRTTNGYILSRPGPVSITVPVVLCTPDSPDRRLVRHEWLSWRCPRRHSQALQAQRKGCRRLKHPRKSIWANSLSALDRLDGARLH